MLLLTNSPNTRSRTPNKEDVGITVVAEVCLVQQLVYPLTLIKVMVVGGRAEAEFSGQKATGS